jgi:hypothetical protein
VAIDFEKGYDLKEASWYLDNPVKKTIWTSIVKKTVYSHWSGSIIQLLLLYKGLNFLTAENLKTGKIHAKKADYRISLLPLTSNSKNETVVSKLHCMSNL